MYRPSFQLACFDTLSIGDRKAFIAAFTEALAFVNLRFLRSNPGTPSLYGIAPKYAFKVRMLGIDQWDDLVQVYASRSGDCKDFVAIRIAEERMAGNFQSVPWVTHKEIRDPRDGRLYQSFHVQHACGGELEDPAVNLGMPKNTTIDQIRRLFR